MTSNFLLDDTARNLSVTLVDTTSSTLGVSNTLVYIIFITIGAIGIYWVSRTIKHITIFIIIGIIAYILLRIGGLI